jgi:hemerythrin
MKTIIPSFRERAGLSIVDASRYLSLPVETYERYENGDTEIPLRLIYRMAAIFGVDVDALLEGGSPRLRMRVVYRDSKLRVERLEGGKPVTEKERLENYREQAMATRRKILDWHQPTGMNFFDDPRKQLIDMTNTLYTVNLTGGWTYSRAIFEESLRHALRYFQDMKNEEQIMEKISYPGYRRHKNEHILFLKEIHRQVERYKANQTIDVKTFVLFLKDWVLSHMGVTDRSFIFYLTRLKREGHLAGIIMRMKRTPDNRVVIK